MARFSSKQADDLSSVSREHLESAITEAVKSEPDCEAFIGVVVARIRPQSRGDANWWIRGVRFGKADRDKSGKALAAIVERMQREFRLVEDEGSTTQNRIL